MAVCIQFVLSIEKYIKPLHIYAKLLGLKSRFLNFVPIDPNGIHSNLFKSIQVIDMSVQTAILLFNFFIRIFYNRI